MDFEDTAEEAGYRAAAREWIREAGKGLATHSVMGRGEGAEDLQKARLWQGRKAGAGYACITWPETWGGAGGTPIQELIFAQEEAVAGLATRYFASGLGMCVPTIIQFCEPSVADRLAPPAIRGDELWCQLFSEPRAGSDLAGVHARAVLDGDHWVVRGQKVWTTGAHQADWGLLLARTDPRVPKHRGLSVFWLDMRSDGVVVRPIRQMNGGREFNEVFLENVRIPAGQIVGKPGRGWEVITATLMRERVDVGGISGPDVAQMLLLAQQTPGLTGPVAADPAFRDRLADWYVAEAGLRLTRYRTITSLSRGQTPGPESAIGNLVAASQMQDMARYAIEMQDATGIAVQEPGTLSGDFQASLMWSPGLRVGGGTEEILKNIIAERVLGLPREPLGDRDTPFQDLAGAN